MQDIARRAGLSKAAIYLYFPGKMALLEALIEAKVAPLARNAQALAQAGAGDPLLALRTLANAAAHILADADAIAVPRLVLSLSARFPDIAEYYRTHVVDVARQAVESLFEAGMAAGAIRRCDVAAAVRAFIGPILFEALWTHMLRGPSAFDRPQLLLEQHFDVLLGGLEQRA